MIVQGNRFAPSAGVLAVATVLSGQPTFAQIEQNPVIQPSLRRHAMAETYGIPARYAAMRNPLPSNARTWQRGAAIYAQRCATCHGVAGRGDGPSGTLLPSPPANLAWFATLPPGRWDGFMYWSIADGGRQFGTAMPSYQKLLSQKDIWAVSAYIRQTLGKSRPT